MNWCVSLRKLSEFICVDPTLVGEENKAFFIRMRKPLPLSSRCVLKTLRGSPKRTISANGGLGLLQMVSEADTNRCTSEDAGPQRGVNCEITHWLGRRTKAFSL